jgi:hypothetical protein
MGMVYLFLLAHLVADFILQPYWLVLRKRRWDGLLLHGAIVLACMLLLPLADSRTLSLWPAMLAITAVHIAADWWKVNHGSRVPGPPIVSFMLDQVIHIATLSVVLSLALPTEMVWGMAGSPVASTAAYACAYIAAAFAAPISVMVWLDPAFKHAALAGRARLRSLFASSAVLVLTVVGGVVALPATLLGLAVVVRRPLSPHPLDMPVGLLAVLSVAAALGVALARM